MLRDAIDLAEKSGAGAESDAMYRAKALCKALVEWRMPASGAGISPLLKKPARDGFASSTLQTFAGGSFDGTRQGVARARKYDLQKRQAAPGGGGGINADVSATIRAQDALADGMRLVQGMPPAEAATELWRLVAAAEEVGLSPSAPAMKRARALANLLSSASDDVEEQNHQKQIQEGGANGKDQSAVLDALFSGYVEPGPLSEEL